MPDTSWRWSHESPNVSVSSVHPRHACTRTPAPGGKVISTRSEATRWTFLDFQLRRCALKALPRDATFQGRGREPALCWGTPRQRNVKASSPGPVFKRRFLRFVAMRDGGRPLDARGMSRQGGSLAPFTNYQGEPCFHLYVPFCDISRSKGRWFPPGLSPLLPLCPLLCQSLLCH